MPYCPYLVLGLEEVIDVLMVLEVVIVVVVIEEVIVLVVVEVEEVVVGGTIGTKSCPRKGEGFSSSMITVGLETQV